MVGDAARLAAAVSGSAIGGTAPPGAPMARYAVARRAGDFVLVSGVVAVDAAAGRVVSGYADLPEAAHAALRGLGYCTGQLTVDLYEAPAVAQSWAVLERIRRIAVEHGGDMASAVKLVQYFRDLRHYPFYARVRNLFYPGEPPASTVVEVSRFLPGDAALIEVEATLFIPR